MSLYQSQSRGANGTQARPIAQDQNPARPQALTEYAMALLQSLGVFTDHI
jgi:hypothetical protein